MKLGDPVSWLFLAVVVAGGAVALIFWDIIPLVLALLAGNLATLPLRLSRWSRAGRPDGPLMAWWERLPGPSKNPDDYR